MAAFDLIGRSVEQKRLVPKHASVYNAAVQNIAATNQVITMLNQPEPTAEKKEAVVVKKYANRRLYNTETSTYVTLDDLAAMVRSDRDFVVFDAKTSDDLTHSVLTQIIVEQEAKSGGQMLLSVPFLRQLIRFYDDSIGKMVPSYLQMSMDTLVKEQEKFRTQMGPLLQQNPFGSAALEAMQAQTAKNMAMFQQAMKQTMTMWSPFTGNFGLPGAKVPEGAKPETAPAASTEPKPATNGQANHGQASSSDLADLKAELAAMQQKIEKLSERK
jgi:polyhydroxyalkanoate synthesis repressor PhaR